MCVRRLQKLGNIHVKLMEPMTYEIEVVILTWHNQDNSTQGSKSVLEIEERWYETFKEL